MRITGRFLLLAGSLALYISQWVSAEVRQPNVLWILTDDQRFDSIQAFNRMVYGQDESPLGYVESPNVDKLAASGTTFINTYVHAQGCAPSRASMHYGRYPHHTGIYEFEYHNRNAEHCRPALPEQMQALGYQTFHVGKLGVRIRNVVDGQARPYDLYEQDINFKKMWFEGSSDWTKGEVKEVNGIQLDEPVHCDYFISPDGTIEHSGSGLNDLEQFQGHSQRIDEKYDLLRMYNAKKPKAYGAGEIIGGVSPQPAGKTRDGAYNRELFNFLENPGKVMTVGSQTYRGVDPSKPLFLNIGYDFPHTPVLPPKSYRTRFQQKNYRLPSKDESDIAALPPQLKKLVSTNHSDHYTEAEKQQMVQDYYAFCAYGDALVGDAARAFIKYSKANKQPWLVVYVCGDHGWKLNDHGAISKFSPWRIDSNNPIVVVSSDKKAFPAGKVVTDFTEFVDLMPTMMAAGGADLKDPQFDYLDGYDLAKVVSGELAARDYVVGESHAVTGPRATIRTEKFMFSLKSRPDKRRGVNMEWALNASYDELEPVLYNLSTDPGEFNNLAFNKEYEQVAQKLKQKLLDIVIGDGRVEIDWGQKVTGMDPVILNLSPGADDKQLKL